MKAITIITQDDRRHQFHIPKGCNGHLCLRALHAANRGEDFAGLSASESEFVADMVAELQPAEEVSG